MAITINIDNNSIKDTIRKIKYVRFINEILKKNNNKDIIHKSVFQNNKIIFDEDERDLYELNLQEYEILDFYLDCKTIPLIDLLFFEYPNNIHIPYTFRPDFDYDEGEYDEEELKEEKELIARIEEDIKKDFEIDDNIISIIYMNAEQYGCINIYNFYNKEISKAISLVANDEIEFKKLKQEIVDMIDKNIYFDCGIISSIVEDTPGKYVLSFISGYSEMQQLYYCSYDLYKFYNKCLDILKENNVKVGD